MNVNSIAKSDYTHFALGSLFAAVLVKLGSTHIQQITNLTAFASAANAGGFFALTKSASTLRTSSATEDDKKTAQIALMVSVVMLFAATFCRGTTILKTRHTSLPSLNKFSKPLAAASIATAILTPGVISSTKKTIRFISTKMDERAKAAELNAKRAEAAALNAKVDSNLAIVLSDDYNQKEKVQQIDTKENFLVLADAARFVLDTSDEYKHKSAQVTDDMIGYINAKAEDLNKDEDSKIEGWLALKRT
jgi:hypothetical protein